MNITPQGRMNTPYPNAYVDEGMITPTSSLATRYAVSQSLLNARQGRIQRPFIQAIG